MNRQSPQKTPCARPAPAPGRPRTRGGAARARCLRRALPATRMQAARVEATRKRWLRECDRRPDSARRAGVGARGAAHVQRLALGARGMAAERLLAALVAGLPADLVVYAVAAGVVAVHEQPNCLPQSAGFWISVFCYAWWVAQDCAKCWCMYTRTKRPHLLTATTQVTCVCACAHAAVAWRAHDTACKLRTTSLGL